MSNVILSSSILSCESVYKLPVTDTLYKKFFEFSEIEFLRGTVNDRVKAWTSSFNRKTLFNRSVWADYPSITLNETYKQLRSNLVILSGYDYFKYMIVTSMVQRLFELTCLSLKNKVDQQNWRTNTKYWVKAITDLTPYILMYFLGYPILWVLICKFFTVLISNQIPYKISNFIREMDLISNDKYLKLLDFLKRNCLVMLRNIFVTYVLYNLILRSIFILNPIPGEERLFKDDWAEIEFCVNNEGKIGLQLSSSASAEKLRWMTNGLGWMVGKMLFDLVWALLLQKGLRVKDLRDPLRTDDKFRQELRQKIKNAKDEAFKKRKQYLDSEAHKPRHKKDVLKGLFEPFASNHTVYMSSNKPVNLKPKVMQEQAARKQKSKTRGSQNESLTSLDLQAQRAPLLSFDHSVRNDTFTFVRLAGNLYEGANTWGVIIKDSVKPGHLSRFVTSLSSGHIGRGTIKRLGTKAVELRPKTLDVRLIGRLHRDGIDYEATGLGAEGGIYKELQNYMPLEDARIVSEVLREEANSKERTELITFSKEIQKHRNS